MNKTKELLVQMMWELVGSIFVAIGIYNFAVQAKFPIEYTCCNTLLQIIRKEVFYQFHSLYDCIFVDY